MSEQYLALFSEVYNALLTAAEESGLSPENWIASQLILHSARSAYR
jgi:hypothetical protein